MERCVPLEPQVEAVCQTSSRPPPIFELSAAQGRMALEEAQDSPIYKYPTRAKRVVVNTGRWDTIPAYLVEPETVYIPANVILYIHGAGWMFGSYHTHKKLIRRLAARAGLLLIFPEYNRSPEVWYPIAIEQCYNAMCTVPELVWNMGYTANPDTSTATGDSMSDSMATALILMSRFRRGPAIQKQLLYYSVTNACFNTGLYYEFAQSYYPYRAGMEWLWNRYTMSQKDRNQITASPLQANLKQLRGPPDTMILNGGVDALRDEGEAHITELRQVGVDVTVVRFQAIIHDFVVLNSLNQTKACWAAMDVSTEWINRKNVEKQWHSRSKQQRQATADNIRQQK